MPIELMAWHASLCLFAVLNGLSWLFLARRFAGRSATLPADVRETRRALLWLSAVYVLGCAFRSLWPMLDEPRVALFDTPFSRIAVGRSVATIAEICFVAQWVLLLHEAAAGTGRWFLKRIANLLLPLAVAAETVSWLAVLKRNNLWHAVENSLWTFGALLVLVALARLRTIVQPNARRWLTAGIIAVGAYIAFMVIVDVPMYLRRWYASTAPHLPLSAGLDEVLRRTAVIRETSFWRADMAWLTLYFSAAVWISLSLVALPPLRGLLRLHPTSQRGPELLRPSA